MRTYWNTDQSLRNLDKWEPNCWVQVTCPTPDDEDFLFNELEIPTYFLDDIRDKDERARYEYEEGWSLIILRIPYVKEVRSQTPHTTIPLGIILNKNICVTVCNYETKMMKCGLHRFRRSRLSSFPFFICLVSEALEADQCLDRGG